MYNLEINSQDYTSYSITNNNKSIDFTDPKLIIGLFHDTNVTIDDKNNITPVDKVVFPRNIVGELELYSKYTFKPNKKGVACYIFRPIDIRYPKCMVHSTIKRKYNENVYVTIDYTKWQKNDTFPCGNINKILGSIYDKDAIQNAIIYKYNLCYNNKKCNFKGIPNDYNTIINNISNREYITDTIISIDPAGCSDIDDAFSINRINDYIIVDIHISDVYYLLSSLHIIDNIEAMSSIYLIDSIKHMLPNIISSNYGSLQEDTMRLMLSLKIKMCCKTNNIIHTELRKTYGKITKNYTYDNCPKYINTFYIYISKMYMAITKSSINIRDSHKFIEALMIIYNTLFCKYILHNGGKPIYRIQKSSDTIINERNRIDDRLSRFLSIIQSRCAEYSFIPNGHVSLDIEKYTHATSPLRRIVDLMNQEIFYKNDSDLITKFPLNRVNAFNKKLNMAYRDLNKLMLAFRVYNTSAYYTKCFVYDLNIESNRLYLYFPDENLSIKTTIVHTKIGHIYSITCDTIDGYKHVVLNNSIDNSIINIPLHTLLDVSVNGKPNIYNPDKSIKISLDQISLE